MKKTQTILISILIITILVLSGCSTKPFVTEPKLKTESDPIETSLESSDEFVKFSSPTEMQEYITNNVLSAAQSQTYSYRSSSISSVGGEMMGSVAMADSSGMKSSSPSGSATDYSQTNVQVEGVDEADFIKNNGEVIYFVKGSKLYVIDAYPAEDAEIVSEIDFEGRVNNLFLNEDRLVVFADESDQEFKVMAYDYIPRNHYVSKTHAYIYDVSDNSDLDLVEEFSIEGNFQDARMIGNYVYMITRDHMSNYGNIDFPEVKLSSGQSLISEVYYFPNPETSYNLNSVTAFDVFDTDEVSSKSFLLGYSNTLYVSEDNIYISYGKNMPWSFYRRDNKNKFFDVVLPLLSQEIQTEVSELMKETDDVFWMKLTSILEEMYNNMQENDKEELIQEISDAIEEYEIKLEIERRKSVIHKISIDGLDIDYEGKGEVNGRLLNQFSLDEYDEHLRVATTTYIWREGRQTYNNVYVLNDDLDVVGEIEDIAPGERIYSTRFMRDKLYMVTFKQIDPFFVIDLEDPENPEILGQLKIPGYSSYLHPYSENLIIGVGMEVDSGSTEGVKIALFDVSDFENPTEVDKYEVGESGSHTPILNEHKAFLLSKEKGILVLPIRENVGRVYDEKYQYYRDSFWNGAYVFNIDENGFSLRGKIEHIASDSNSRYSYSNQVKRSLFMDDVLYTLSSQYLKMNDLNDLNLINTIEFDDGENLY